MESFIPLEPVDDFLEMTKHGVSATGLEDGEIVAVGGIAYTSDDKGAVWLKISKKVDGSFAWARTIRETFSLMKEAVGKMQISTYVLSDFCKGEKLARMIGLRKTDKMEQYNGNTYYKYTAVT